MITELTECPKCQSKKMKRLIWKQAEVAHTGDLRKSIDRFGIGCVVEFVCQDCGFKHTEI